MAAIDDEFDMFDDGDLDQEIGQELSAENADGKGDVEVERDAMKRHHYRRLVEFCESPEEDADGFYDINALTDNVEQALEEDAENNDHFLRKVLEQYGWDGRGQSGAEGRRLVSCVCASVEVWKCVCESLCAECYGDSAPSSVLCAWCFAPQSGPDGPHASLCRWGR